MLHGRKKLLKGKVEKSTEKNAGFLTGYVKGRGQCRRDVAHFKKGECK